MSKSLWQSKTFWVNAITAIVGVLTVLSGSDLVADYPQTIAALVAAQGILNILLRIITDTSIKLFVLLACLCLPALAQAQFATGEQESYLRSLIPLAEFRDDPQVRIYTHETMPPAYQFCGPGGSVTGFHLAAYNISGDFLEARKGHGRGGNGNIEFPWKSPGGTDKSVNCHSFRFVRLPDGKPVVWWTERRYEGDNNRGQSTQYDWTFPVGTIFGEVLTMTGTDGYEYPFELRTRERFADHWQPDLYRQFPTREHLLACLDTLGDDRTAALQAHLRRPLDSPVETLTDSSHRTQRAFTGTAQRDVLPAIPADVVSRLLTEHPYQTAIEEVWAGEQCYCPTTEAPFHIVPAHYDATFLGSSGESCTKCHDSALKHVDQFDAPRQWYGHVRGCSEGILSFGPYKPSCVSGNGGHVNASMHDIPGVIERYDPSRHSSADYVRLPQ